jgi:hypothetical protein
MVDMKLLIITNNPLVRNTVASGRNELIFLDGTVMEVLNRCIEMLGMGWVLAVDPLAGYLARPNPFHTIILQKSNQTNEIDAVRYLYGLTALEKLVKKYNDELEGYIWAAATSRQRKDHMEVDRSIAVRSLGRLIA